MLHRLVLAYHEREHRDRWLVERVRPHPGAGRGLPEYVFLDLGPLTDPADQGEAYFASETNVYLRLEYISAQLYQFFKLDIKIVKYVKRITLGEWGSIYDLLFCAGFFGEHGWNFGLTSEAPETTVATTTEGAGSGCSERGGLITIDFSSNTTVLTSSVNTAYASWTRTQKANFASYKKRIETIIWGVEFSSVESKLTQITTVFTGYAPAGTTSSTLVMSIEITGWGTVQQFCDCQN